MSEQNEKKQESRFVVQKGEVTFLTPEEVEKLLKNRYEPFGESKKNQKGKRKDGAV